MTEQSPEPPNEFMGQELSEEDKVKYAEHLRLMQSKEAQEDDAKNDNIGDEFAR